MHRNYRRRQAYQVSCPIRPLAASRELRWRAISNKARTATLGLDLAKWLRQLNSRVTTHGLEAHVTGNILERRSRDTGFKSVRSESTESTIVQYMLSTMN
jgi:hypothetical protein